MVYDQNIDVSAVHAPAQANIVIRSQAGQQPPLKPKTEVKPHVVSYNGQRIDIKRFANYLNGVKRTTSTGMCARGVRLALQSAGARFTSHPVAAADWGPTLQKIGYRKINQSFDKPQKGDIYIIHRTGKHRYGHIAAYSGKAWVSDFKQRSHDVYKKSQVTYSYYRLKGL